MDKLFRVLKKEYLKTDFYVTRNWHFTTMISSCFEDFLYVRVHSVLNSSRLSCAIKIVSNFCIRRCFLTKILQNDPCFDLEDLNLLLIFYSYLLQSSFCSKTLSFFVRLFVKWPIDSLLFVILISTFWVNEFVCDAS